jgi:hypothetical protein
MCPLLGLFQSLKGFGDDWRHPSSAYRFTVSAFQSLKGFGDDWR